MYTIMYQGNKSCNWSNHETKDGGYYFYICKNTSVTIEKYRTDNISYNFFNLTEN